MSPILSSKDNIFYTSYLQYIHVQQNKCVYKHVFILDFDVINQNMWCYKCQRLLTIFMKIDQQKIIKTNTVVCAYTINTHTHTTHVLSRISILYVSYNIGIECIELHTDIHFMKICHVVWTMNCHKSSANFISNSFEHIHCISQHILTHFKCISYMFHIIS